MLTRDFSKSNKEYFKKNKWIRLGVCVFLLLGIVIAACFGFRGNFELAGYTEFSVSIHTEDSKTITKFSSEIELAVKQNGGEFDTISVFDEGDNTKLVVRYLNSLSEEKQNAIDGIIIKQLSLNEEDISAHLAVSPIIRGLDYLYTALAIVLLVTAASIFAYFRYNGASAIAIILSAILATSGYLCVTAILRLTVGLSYFAMLVALNLFVVYGAFVIFEHIRDGNYLSSNDYASAINSAVKNNKWRICFISVALLFAGLMFVIFAPSSLKYLSLNIMFLGVVLLAVLCYALPFIWSVFITYTHKSKNK